MRFRTRHRVFRVDLMHPPTVLELSHEESAAIARILRTVAAEADRMQDADPKAWAEHADAIASLTADVNYSDGCLEALDESEAAAIRFLIEEVEWESVMEPCEGTGMARLRTRFLAGAPRRER